MLAAPIARERDPDVLAELAKGVLRRRSPQLRQALRGRFTEHHALTIRLCLNHTTHLEGAIAQLDDRVDTLFATHAGDAKDIGEAGGPFVRACDRLDTIPGVGKRAAETIIAESGRRGALLRRAPGVTVHATRRRTRLKQAARALRVLLPRRLGRSSAAASRRCPRWTRQSMASQSGTSSGPFTVTVSNLPFGWGGLINISVQRLTCPRQRPFWQLQPQGLVSGQLSPGGRRRVDHVAAGFLLFILQPWTASAHPGSVEIIAAGSVGRAAASPDHRG